MEFRAGDVLESFLETSARSHGILWPNWSDCVNGEAFVILLANIPFNRVWVGCRKPVLPPGGNGGLSKALFSFSFEEPTVPSSALSF